jgi:hypothetical protein
VESTSSALQQQQELAAAAQAGLEQKLAEATHALLQQQERADSDRLEAARKLEEAAKQLQALEATRQALTEGQAALRQCGKEKAECVKRLDGGARGLEEAVNKERERCKAQKRAWEQGVAKERADARSTLEKLERLAGEKLQLERANGQLVQQLVR